MGSIPADTRKIADAARVPVALGRACVIAITKPLHTVSLLTVSLLTAGVDGLGSANPHCSPADGPST
jgi:hypothetical protein